MSNLKAKLKKESGFTLVEMLIVVAIIAILIAISIPLINNALERAKHATDAANERSAKAELLIQYLSEGSTTTAGWYDAVNGKIVADGSGIPAYGKHKTHTTMIIYVKVDTTNGEVSMQWVTPSNSAPATIDETTNDGLCSKKEVNHS